MDGIARDEGPLDRRGFLTRVASLLSTGALLAAAAWLAGISTRFLFPRRSATEAWLFVAEMARVTTGSAISYVTPTGEPVSVARIGPGNTAADFVALSTTCPHLGCRVHWEGPNDRFFCPCHNGVFDPQGKAVAGPPADEGRDLQRYPLRADGPLLFIRVPTVDPLRGRA